MSVLVHIGFAIKNLFPTFLKWLKHNKDKNKGQVERLVLYGGPQWTRLGFAPRSL
jgi:hypothetical protein